MAMDDLENAEILSRTPGALGTISSCQMNTMKLGLQQIAIEATVSATAGTDLASRSLSRPFVVIIKDGARPAVRHFVDFLLSAEAKRVMKFSTIRALARASISKWLPSLWSSSVQKYAAGRIMATSEVSAATRLM